MPSNRLRLPCELPGALLALTLVAGCATSNKIAPELLLLEPSAFVGTVLGGPRVESPPVELAWERAFGVELLLEYRAQLPSGGVPPTGRLVVRRGAAEVFGARAELAHGVRLLGDDARVFDDALAPIWRRRVAQALAPGVTLALHATPNLALEQGPRPVWSRWGVEITRRADPERRLEVALSFEGRVIPRPAVDEEELDAAPRPDPTDVQERLVLGVAPEPGGVPLRILLPAPSSAKPGGGFVVQLTLLESAGDSVQRSTDLVIDERRAALDRSSQLEQSFRFETTDALRALSKRELRRSALVFLAQSTSARLTEELALVAEADALGDFLAELSRRSEAVGAVPEGAAPFGWFLESTAWRWLTARAQQEEREIEAELGSLLLRHAGEVGRYPDLVREVVDACVDGPALDAALRAENALFLADAHPGSRVRAFDWLTAHGVPVEGYDPLGSSDERRAALEALEAAAAGAAEEDGR